MNSALSNVFQTIEDAECVADPQLRARLLEQAISVLSTQDHKHSAEVQHAIGYAWYLHPENTELRNNMVARHLRHALALNPDHKFARLYLGHHHYDRGQFAEALALLSTFQAREFSAFDQTWRDAKVSELILCCILQLGEREKIAHAASRFCDALTYCDEGMNPLPDELSKTLVERLHNVSKDNAPTNGIPAAPPAR